MNTIKGTLHLIATDKPSPNIILLKDTNEMSLFDDKFYQMWQFHQQFGDFKPTNATYQHLYITTDEEIKDWYIDDTNTVRKAVTSDKEYWAARKDYRKIVATTNSELYIIGTKPVTGNIHYSINISKIHTSFIEQYVKAYNDGTPITEVLLEIDNFNGYLNSPVTFNQEYGKLKLSSDGSVIIHPIHPIEEKMYTREEFRKAVRQAWIMSNGMVKFDEWFNKNYPQ